MHAQNGSYEARIKRLASPIKTPLLFEGMSAASYGHPSSSSASSFGPPAQESGKNTLSTELNRGKKQGPSDRTPSPSDNATTATTSRVPRSNGIVDSLEKAKQRQNTSGGFLLGLPNGQRDKLFAKTVAGVSPKDSKSKDKATSNASRSISYTTPTRGPVHGSKPAAGSSPLSTELINQKVKDDEGGTNLRYPPNVTG